MRRGGPRKFWLGSMNSILRAVFIRPCTVQRSVSCWVTSSRTRHHTDIISENKCGFNSFTVIKPESANSLSQEILAITKHKKKRKRKAGLSLNNNNNKNRKQTYGAFSHL